MVTRHTHVAVLVGDARDRRAAIDVDWQVQDFLRWFALSPAESDAGRARPPQAEPSFAVVPAHVLGLHELRRVEALDLAGHVHLERRGVEQGDAIDARPAGDERVPGGIGSDPDRRHDSQARHHRPA